MRVRVTVPGKEGKKLKSRITEMMLSVEAEDHSMDATIMVRSSRKQ